MSRRALWHGIRVITARACPLLRTRAGAGRRRRARTPATITFLILAIRRPFTRPPSSARISRPTRPSASAPISYLQSTHVARSEAPIRILLAMLGLRGECFALPHLPLRRGERAPCLACELAERRRADPCVTARAAGSDADGT